jgi:voltage-gated potassium channel
MVHSYIAILILFCAILYVSALIFKVVENYDSINDVYYFGNFYNCLWYLISTMTGTGYGDYFPKTLIGRIVGVLCCIIGIFLLGLVVATLVILTQFNQDEKKVSYFIKNFLGFC